MFIKVFVFFMVLSGVVSFGACYWFAVRPLREKRKMETSLANAALLLFEDKWEEAVAIVTDHIPEVWEMPPIYLEIAQHICRAASRRLFGKAKQAFDQEQFAEASGFLREGITYAKFGGVTELAGSVAQLREELSRTHGCVCRSTPAV